MVSVYSGQLMPGTAMWWSNTRTHRVVLLPIPASLWVDCDVDGLRVQDDNVVHLPNSTKVCHQGKVCANELSAADTMSYSRAQSAL